MGLTGKALIFNFAMRKRGEMLKEASFEWMTKVISAALNEEVIVKMKKNICIKPDSIMQSGIIKTAIYKMEIHITRIHFEECHNKGGLCGNERAKISNYILQ